MRLSALNALVCAIDEGSLRTAAKRLGVSQPSLSKQMRELEREFAAPLLVRSAQGVLPTAQGKVLYSHALRIKREMGLAVEGIQQLSGFMSGELSVGAVPLAVMLLIPETLRTFGKVFPDIRVRLSEELYIAQLQRLRTCEVDVAVGGIPTGLASGEFIVEKLMDTEMVVVVRKGSPYARVKSLRELTSAKWVYTGASSDDGYAKMLFELHGMQAPPVGAVVNSTLALLSIVATGDFVGLMPQQITRHPLAAQLLVVVPVKEHGLPLTVGAIVRSGSVVSPKVRHFISHLHRAAHHVQVNALKAVG